MMGILILLYFKDCTYVVIRFVGSSHFLSQRQSRIVLHYSSLMTGGNDTLLGMIAVLLALMKDD